MSNYYTAVRLTTRHLIDVSAHLAPCSSHQHIRVFGDCFTCPYLGTGFNFYRSAYNSWSISYISARMLTDRHFTRPPTLGAYSKCCIAFWPRHSFITSVWSFSVWSWESSCGHLGWYELSLSLVLPRLLGPLRGVLWRIDGSPTIAFNGLSSQIKKL